MVEACSRRQIGYACQKMSAVQARPKWSILTAVEVASLIK